MDGDVLSHEEVESLLQAIETDQTQTGAPNRQGGGAPGSPAGPASRPRERVQPYDFKRPERVGQEQMRALQSLHEGFARNFGASLSTLLRTIVEVKLTSVDQLTYSEFVFSLESPTCFNLLTASPLEGHLILDISPSVLYPIIDRLLGGGKDSDPVARRPLTEIELRLVTRVTDRFLKEMGRAWENVLRLELAVDRVESNPQLVQIVPPSEVVILIGFEVAIGNVRGILNLCIPFNSIERIGGRLTSNTWIGQTRSDRSSESLALIGDRLNASRLEVVVTLAETRLTTGDLIGLRVGDIITTDKDIHTPLDLAIQGVSRFHAAPGASKGRLAVRILEPLGYPGGRKSA
ncbi:MAG: flagellar motor switch protein FliM [Planctomycetes bacterium]|nr:flagellar motor switch protein FliM [Planctomycetota bacterium]